MDELDEGKIRKSVVSESRAINKQHELQYKSMSNTKHYERMKVENLATKEFPLRAWGGL